MGMRVPLIAGNWKMYKTREEALEFAKRFKELYHDTDIRAAVIAPYTQLDVLAGAFKGSGIGVGAQNVHFEDEGAFTGEISVPMLRELGVDYCIVGHSERRQYFGETDATVNARVKAALAKGLKPIICVGETLEEREAGKTAEVVIRQTEGAFKDIDKAELDNIVIAYEPVWAIGTGKTATADDANDTIKVIRDTMAKLYCPKCAEDRVRIQYGGSMNPKNVKELMAMPEIDGGLIGGASLKAEDFSKVVNY